MNAIFWEVMGGGAAGYANQYVSVIPSERPAVSVLNKGTVADGVVMTLSHAYHLVLTWQGDQLLIVQYPDSAPILYAGPGGAYTPLTPRLKVRHLGVPSHDGQLDGGSRCGT